MIRRKDNENGGRSGGDRRGKANGMNGTSTSGYIEIARAEKTVLMRVVGLGNMNISLTLKDFILSCLRGGYAHFALDLGACEGMDSTFMGTIIGIATQVQSEGGWICLVNVSEENRRLLEMIGVWGMVPVRQEFPLAAVETECLTPNESPLERIEQIRQAHANLVAIDERNRDRFGRFLASLEAEMDLTGASPADPVPAPDEEAAETTRRSRDSLMIHRVRKFAGNADERDPAPSDGNPAKEAPDGADGDDDVS